MKAIDYVTESKHLPEEIEDFHDQKDLFKTIFSWWGDKIEITWVQAHVFVIDYFLWFMGLHGYKLQKIRAKDVDFHSLTDSKKAMREELHKSFADLIKNHDSGGEDAR